jgi:hypothetical protein
LIHLSVVGHLGCFHNLAIVNRAAIIIGTVSKKELGRINYFQLDFFPMLRGARKAETNP